MADLDLARRIALSLPETTGDDGFGVRSKDKVRGFAWTWNERIEPKKPRVPNPAVLAVRTANLDDKDALIAAEPDIYFTEPHYNGFPAVLVRLANIQEDELRELLTEAWRCMAPKTLVKAFDVARNAGG